MPNVKPTVSVKAGSTTQLTATVEPVTATNKNVTFVSDKPAKATVTESANPATVTAVAVGNATITVTTEDGSFTDTCEVTVTAAEVAATGVTLDKETAALTV